MHKLLDKIYISSFKFTFIFLILCESYSLFIPPEYISSWHFKLYEFVFLLVGIAIFLLAIISLIKMLFHIFRRETEHALNNFLLFCFMVIICLPIYAFGYFGQILLGISAATS